VSEALEELRQAPAGAKLVGIRHQVHDEVDPAWLLRDDVLSGIEAVGKAGLTTTSSSVLALRAFRPELVLVASGLDACAIDPQGRMLLHSDGYRELARLMRAAATELCAGHLVLCHEGGYSPAYAPFCALAIVEELSGIDTGVDDPFLEIFQGMAGQDLTPHQLAAIEAAVQRKHS
jgi:Histone deacetylase domain